MCLATYSCVSAYTYCTCPAFIRYVCTAVCLCVCVCLSVLDNEQEIKQNCMRKSQCFNLFLHYSSEFNTVQRGKPLIMKLLKTRTQCKHQQTARLNIFTFSFIKNRIDPRSAYKDIWLQNACNVQMFEAFV